MQLEGTYDVVVKSPMGDQASKLTVNLEGDGWSGSMAGGMGAMDITGGTIEGHTLHWIMNMTVPMPMTLNCKATVNGDSIEGMVRAGAFGEFPLTGTRAS